jgi:hypothetical protein
MDSIDPHKTLAELNDSAYDFNGGVEIDPETIEAWKLKCIKKVTEDLYRDPFLKQTHTSISSGNAIIHCIGTRNSDGCFQFDMTVSFGYIEHHVVVQDDNYMFRTDTK